MTTATQELVGRLPKDFRVYSPSEQAWYDDLPQAIRDTIERLQGEVEELKKENEILSENGDKFLKEKYAAERERDEYKIWWERDSTSLGKVLNDLSMQRACKEDFRAQAANLRGELAERDARIAEHEQFRHQHRDCDVMGVENQMLKQRIAAQAKTVEALEAKLNRADKLVERLERKRTDAEDDRDAARSEGGKP